MDTMSAGEAHLEALLDIINVSARQAIAEYKKSGNDAPTVYSKTYHPVDSAFDTVALKKAVRLLEGACQQLCASLAPPQHTLYSFALSFEWACVGVVARAKVADVLAKFPDGLHVDELAKLVNLDKGNLTRILRLLALKGCFTEVAPYTFANNRISLATLSGSNYNVLHIAADGIYNSAVTLYEAMTDPEYATSREPHKAPLIYALKKQGFEGDLFFDQIKQDPERLGNFHRAMVNYSSITGSSSILDHYPWNEVNSVCDIGASIGPFSMPLAKMYPHIKIVDQDLPEVVALAKDVWAKESPEALRNKQVEFVPLNFLERGPVEGQDVYYLSNVIHDWHDAEATLILRNVKSAMAPHSRLLIHDYVFALAGNNPNSAPLNTDIAPAPLLPDYGNGNNRMYQHDMMMWLAGNAKDRTLDEFIALGHAAGLRLEKVYDLAEMAVLDFRLPDGEAMSTPA